jgi:hypothetical protein
MGVGAGVGARVGVGVLVGVMVGARVGVTVLAATRVGLRVGAVGEAQAARINATNRYSRCFILKSLANSMGVVHMYRLEKLRSCCDQLTSSYNDA